MIYKVFMDTNIYDGSNYSFSNPTFTGLKKLAQDGAVQLQINSVVEGEVQGHIKDRVATAVKNMNKTFNDKALTGFRYMPGFKERMEKIDEKEWIQKAQKEFSDLLVACNTEHISINGIDVEKIMQDYFKQKPPFETKKPDEFKDAIAIASIAAEIKNLPTDAVYCVISNDNGFVDAIKENVIVPVANPEQPEEKGHTERLQIFNNMRSFLDYLSTLEKRSDYLKRFLQSGMADDDIKAAIEEFLGEVDYQIDGIDPWLEEKGVVDTSDIEFEPYVLEVYDDNTAAVALDIKAVVTVEYKYTDEDESFYDKEDQHYLWQTIVENEGTYDIECEIVVLLDITDCGISDESEEDTEDEFEDDCIEVKELLEKPSSIWLDDENCIETENISTTGPMYDYEPDPEDECDSGREFAYTTCPMCGSPIGHMNDAGDGYCINCSRKI